MTSGFAPQLSMSPDIYSPSIPDLSISQAFSGDKLDHLKANWQEWSRQMLITLTLNGLKGYINGTISQPKADSEPRAYANWGKNDDLAFNFLLHNIDEREQEFIFYTDISSAKACWDALEKRHRDVNKGPMRQLQLIRDGISSRFSHKDEPLPAAATRLYQLAKRTLAVGDITVDVLACLYILSALTPYPRLRTLVHHNIASATKEKPYTVADVIQLLENEQRLLDAEHCIAPGGGMAGKTISESKKAPHGKRGKRWDATHRPVRVRDADGRAFILYPDQPGLFGPTLNGKESSVSGMNFMTL